MAGPLQDEIDRRCRAAELRWILQESYAAAPTERFLHYDNPQGRPGDDELWWSGCVVAGNTDVIAFARAFGDELARIEVLRQLLGQLDSAGYS